MLAGLTDPDAGTLVVGDEIWFDAARAIRRTPQQRKIGFVFGTTRCFPT